MSFTAGDYWKAQQLIDSLHTGYQKQRAARREADTLSWRIEVIACERNVVYADSMLVIKRAELAPMLKDFRLEKDTIYQDMGNYVLPQLRTERNAERCYLKPYVDEHGVFYVMSYYVGKPIDYNRIKVSMNDVFVESLPAESGDVHRYEDDGVNHETVMYGPSTLSGIGEVVALHSEERLKIALLGTGTYTYFLNELEKKLFTQTYNLSVVLSDVYELEQQLNKNKARVALLQSRLL